MSDKLTDFAGTTERWQQIRPGEHARSVYVEDAITVASAHQRVFIGTTPRLSAGSGQALRARLENPAVSGRKIIVTKLMTILEQDTYVYGDVLVNPTGGLPTTNAQIMNTMIGSAEAPVAVCRADTGTAMTGGQKIATLGISQGLQEVEFPGLVVTPGVSLGFTFAVGALGSANAQIMMSWFEQDIADL